MAAACRSTAELRASAVIVMARRHGSGADVRRFARTGALVEHDRQANQRGREYRRCDRPRCSDHSGDSTALGAAGFA